MHSWGGGSKLLNPNKSAKCITLLHGKLYSGCQDNSIQEIDLATGTLNTIQSGSRKLLGKANPIHALNIRDGLLYSASSSLNGAAVKIWNASNYSMVGSLPLTLEVRAMAVSSELIYLGCKGGTVEVWCRKKHNRVDMLQTGSNGRVLCMALDADEEVLVIGTSDGKIQVKCSFHLNIPSGKYYVKDTVSTSAGLAIGFLLTFSVFSQLFKNISKIHFTFKSY
ncbi:putative E3 ubiquitin-protein ligase LIN [Camellia sinensis]|uniref:putative E3 ubiquitin-protein ligase LIN n=1 Tax=Camellia sinensis TaxID=4442 RepID=UPI001036F196|nr:putative E3 ubiquitin-protein ligase LIN [Camellia sinensis]